MKGGTGAIISSYLDQEQEVCADGREKQKRKGSCHPFEILILGRVAPLFLPVGFVVFLIYVLCYMGHSYISLFNQKDKEVRTLNLSEALSDLVFIIHASDTHISRDDPHNLSVFREFLSEVVSLRPARLLISGDLCNSKRGHYKTQRRGEWEQYNQAMAEAGLLNPRTVIDIRGNHDVWGTNSSIDPTAFFCGYSVSSLRPDVCKEYKAMYMGQGDSEFVEFNEDSEVLSSVYGNTLVTTAGTSVLFIASQTESVPAAAETFNLAGHYSEKALRRIEHLASEAAASMSVIINHSPLFIDIQEATTYPMGGKLLERLADANIVASFNGHLHANIAFPSPSGVADLSVTNLHGNGTFRLTAMSPGTNLISNSYIRVGEYPAPLVVWPANAVERAYAADDKVVLALVFPPGMEDSLTAGNCATVTATDSSTGDKTTLEPSSSFHSQPLDAQDIISGPEPHAPILLYTGNLRQGGTGLVTFTVDYNGDDASCVPRVTGRSNFIIISGHFTTAVPYTKGEKISTNSYFKMLPKGFNDPYHIPQGLQISIMFFIDFPSACYAIGALLILFIFYILWPLVVDLCAALCPIGRGREREKGRGRRAENEIQEGFKARAGDEKRRKSLRSIFSVTVPTTAAKLVTWLSIYVVRAPDGFKGWLSTIMLATYAKTRLGVFDVATGELVNNQSTTTMTMDTWAVFLHQFFFIILWTFFDIFECLATELVRIAGVTDSARVVLLADPECHADECAGAKEKTPTRKAAAKPTKEEDAIHTTLCCRKTTPHHFRVVAMAVMAVFAGLLVFGGALILYLVFEYYSESCFASPSLIVLVFYPVVRAIVHLVACARLGMGSRDESASSSRQIEDIVEVAGIDLGDDQGTGVDSCSDVVTP